MNYALKGMQIFLDNTFKNYDLLISKGVISDISPLPKRCGYSLSPTGKNLIVIPGLVDVHVHLREPGFFYKESINTGTRAATRGGYTKVLAMPNLSPVPDSLDNLKIQQDINSTSALIDVYPYASITKGQNGEVLSDMEELSQYVVAFSDDGRGVQNTDIMRQAMLKAKSLGKIIVAHCEDNSLLFDGYIHDGKYAKLNGHKGICSASEYKQIERDIELVKETLCSYHICHVSTKESVELIRRAKKDGLDITCETAPHYLVLNDMDLKDDGKFKMNPPIRDEEDRLALIEGIKDGTIDMIATDHAPHSAIEKSKGLQGSLMGVVGLETAFPILYTYLVKKGIITLEKLIELMQVNPSKRFKVGKSIKLGEKADIAVFDLDANYKINPETFLSKGRATPFDGYEVFGECILTISGGNEVWAKK
jgi:dihydroorotase